MVCKWYVNGINKDIDSIDKLIDFIARLTNGYDLITIGSSSGGFIATLLGCKLNAKYIFNFAGQVDLRFQSIYNDLLVDYLRNNIQYSNLKDIIENSNTKVFYFVGANSFIDKRDIEIADSISTILDYNKDSVALYKDTDYSYLCNSEYELLRKLV